MRNRLLCLVVGLSVAGLAAGCARSVATLDRLEERDPLLKRAEACKKIKDIDGAIEVYNKALDRKPRLARAHLEVGLLYDTEKQDYLRAVYHYERYLELRPQAEKRKIIEGLIRQARLSFAASLPHQPSGAIEEIAVLKREISVLRRELAERDKAVGGQGAAAAPPPAKEERKAPQPPEPAPAKPAVETYIVQSGDTLSSIAAKMYRDPTKWKMIYDANRGSLVSPESVRVGQTLVIPR